MYNKNNKIKKQSGFTLIEIMIVVAIIGILSAIALPSYSEHVKKSRRTDAKVELLRLAQMQESYFAQNLSYAETLVKLGFSGTTVVSDGGYYDITLVVATPNPCVSGTAVPCTGFELQALPDSAKAQSQDLCTGFKIDNVGRKTATGLSSTECWGK